MMSSSLSLLRVGLDYRLLCGGGVGGLFRCGNSAAGRAAGGVQLISVGADLSLNVIGDLGVILQKLLGVVAALTQTDIAVVEPCTALLHDAQLDTHIDELAHFGDALTEHDIELGLTERRSTLFFTILARVWLPMN